MEEPVTIVDRDVLKVLSVDTRMDIIKILYEGDRTPSFISKKLNKTDATIVEHLDALVKAGLVKKVEQPGKKFVFYTLTERGYGIVSSKSRRLVIILSSSLIGLFLGSAGILGKLFSYYSGGDSTFGAGAPLAERQIAETIKPIVDTTVTQITAQDMIIQFIFTYGPMLLTILSLIGVGYVIYKKYQFKGAYQ